MRIISAVSEIAIEWEKGRLEASPRSLAALKQALSTIKEIESVKLSGTDKKRFVVVYRSPKGVVEFLRKVTNSIRTAEINFERLDKDTQEFEPKPPAKVDEPPTVLGTLRRWVYVSLASGSIVMAWVGLILPGIPTIPFLILTVYFAGKVSPSFRNRLLDTPVIGTAMRDWSEKHAIRRSVRDRVFIIMALVMTVTLLFTPVESIQFPFVIVFTALTFLMINIVPVFEDPPSDRSTGLLVI